MSVSALIKKYWLWAGLVLLCALIAYAAFVAPSRIGQLELEREARGSVQYPDLVGIAYPQGAPVDLDDYAALAFASRRPATEARGEEEAPSRREMRRAEAQERQRLASARKPIQDRLQKIETELAVTSDQLRELDARLAQPDFYHGGDASEVAAVLKQRGELAQRVDQLESRWLELQAELEAIA